MLLSHLPFLLVSHFEASKGKKVQTGATQRRTNPWFIPNHKDRVEERELWKRNRCSQCLTCLHFSQLLSHFEANNGKRESIVQWTNPIGYLRD